MYQSQERKCTVLNLPLAGLSWNAVCCLLLISFGYLVLIDPKPILGMVGGRHFDSKEALREKIRSFI